jgi:hypothetical protein
MKPEIERTSFFGGVNATSHCVRRNDGLKGGRVSGSPRRRGRHRCTDDRHSHGRSPSTAGSSGPRTVRGPECPLCRDVDRGTALRWKRSCGRRRWEFCRSGRGLLGEQSPARSHSGAGRWSWRDDVRLCPRGEHLVARMRSSDLVLKCVLFLANREALLDVHSLAALREPLRALNRIVGELEP